MPASIGAGRIPRGLLRGLRRLGPAAMTAGLVGLLLLVASVQSRPLLVWNASASAPVGLYGVSDALGIRAGEMVIAWTPEPARSLAARRHYLPANVPLVKRVAAVAGARVCSVGDRVLVDGRVAATRRRADGAGRALPVWTGCRTLGSGELLLLMDGPDSFDGRYFGVTSADLVVGRASLLWVR